MVYFVQDDRQVAVFCGQTPKVILSSVRRIIVYHDDFVIRMLGVPNHALKAETGQRQIVISYNDNACAFGNFSDCGLYLLITSLPIVPPSKRFSSLDQ